MALLLTMRTKRDDDRPTAGQEAPMVITPRMITRLARQIITSLRQIANKARQR
jgi:hypothetical protein